MASSASPIPTISARRSIREENSYLRPNSTYKSQTRIESSQESGNESSSSETEEENLVNTPDNQDISPSRASPSFKKQSKLVVNEEKQTNQTKTHIAKTLNKTKPITNKNIEETQYPSVVNQKFYFIIVIVAVFVGYWYFNGALSSPKETTRKTCTFEKLRNTYNLRDDKVWRHLRIGIEHILNDDQATPGVYLFLHRNTSLSQSLIKEIASSSSLCFDPSLKPFELDRNDFISQNDYGHVIAKYKRLINEGGVLLVANLNEIPGNAARALHAICDVYSPIVRRVVIFLTLVPIEEEGNDIEIAENSLYRLWKGVERFELDPLITRVTDQVFRLY